MVRGCEKRVVRLQRPDSEYFEEVFFVLKDGARREAERTGDIVREATRLLSECGAAPRERRPLGVRPFLLGVAAASAVLLPLLFFL